MSETRLYQPYIDSGEIAYPPSLALGIFERTKQVLEPYFDIDFNGLKQLPSISSETTINPADIAGHFTSPFIAILTMRSIIRPQSSSLEEKGLDGICYFRDRFDKTHGSVSIASAQIPKTESQVDDITATLAHEIAHGYGLKHCVGHICLMTQQLPLDKRSRLVSLNNANAIAPNHFQ